MVSSINNLTVKSFKLVNNRIGSVMSDKPKKSFDFKVSIPASSPFSKEDTFVAARSASSGNYIITTNQLGKLKNEPVLQDLRAKIYRGEAKNQDELNLFDQAFQIANQVDEDTMLFQKAAGKGEVLTKDGHKLSKTDGWTKDRLNGGLVSKGSYKLQGVEVMIHKKTNKKNITTYTFRPLGSDLKPLEIKVSKSAIKYTDNLDQVFISGSASQTKPN
jgi:hypothetical protein